MALDTSMEWIKAVAAAFLFLLAFGLLSKWAVQIFTFFFGLLILGIICWLGSEIGHEHITAWKQLVVISVGTGLLSSLVFTPFSTMLDIESRLTALEAAPLSPSEKQVPVLEKRITKLELPAASLTEDKPEPIKSALTLSKKRSKKRS